MRLENCVVCGKVLTEKEIGWSDIKGGEQKCYQHCLRNRRTSYRLRSETLINTSKYVQSWEPIKKTKRYKARINKLGGRGA